MHKSPHNKQWHISAIILLFLTIIAAWLHREAPQPTPKDKGSIHLTLLSFASGVHSTCLPKADPYTAPSGKPAVRVDNISNAALLAFFWWLSRDYSRSPPLNATLTLSPRQYRTAMLGVMAMMGYIGYFFYQKYIVDKVPGACFVKDIGIFGLMSSLTSLVFFPAFFNCLQEAMDHESSSTSRKLLFRRWALLEKILGCYSGLVVYTLASKLITYCKSNHKIKGRKFDSMWLFSTLIVASIWGIVVDPSQWSLFTKLLWAIPVFFLYVQAYWHPELPSAGNETIDRLIAALFHVSHLWEGLGCVMMVYHLHRTRYKIIGVWLAWQGVTYALYHLDTKKTSPKEA